MDALVRNAIAKIEVVGDGQKPAIKSRGTGFLVGDGLVLTALHVVANRRSDPPEPIPGTIRLTFPGLQTEASIHPGLWDTREDWALLDCRRRPDARAIPMAEWQISGTLFETFGFPDANPRDGMVQSGRVKNHSAELDGVTALQLFSEEAAAGNGAPAKGLSGAPVLVDDAVVGLLRFALMDQQRQTVAGTLYACPVTAVIERVGDLLPIPDPCHGLPGLPRRPLPVEPFRYLERFTERDAEIFFGRRREIRQLYELLTSNDAPPLVLLYGQSGVGKSSFLDAGVLPRLAWHYDTRYLRRDPRRSLLELLVSSLAKPDRDVDARDLGRAWLGAEAEVGKPVILVLDQLEEVFTRPRAAHSTELEELVDALAALFGAVESRPRGRLLLAFRKEWLPEIQKLLEVRNLSHGKVFLEGLDRSSVIEVVNGLTATRRLRQHYALSVQSGLAEAIADDLTSDPSSPIAPTLEILLTKLWREARRLSPHAPAFTVALYRKLRSEGLMLGDFVDQQLALLRERHRSEVDSGLAIDLLSYHTTPLVTAGVRGWDEISADYGHVRDRLESVLQTMIDLYLLVGSTGGEPGSARSTRLAHDTLAVHVRRRLDVSDQPGPRARRILENRGKEWSDGREGAPLDEWDLAVVESGLDGMRSLSPDEERLLAASRRMRDRQRRARSVRKAAAATAVLAIVGVAVWALWEKTQVEKQQLFTELSRSTDQVENLLSVEPVEGLMLAIAAAGRSFDKLRGEVRPPLQYSLNRAINESWETNQVRHGAPVSAVAVHPFGHLVASAGDMGVLKVWIMPDAVDRFGPNAEPHEPLVEVKAHEQRINALAFSPDGLLLASASDDATVRLWGMNGKPMGAPLADHEGPVLAVAFSPASPLIVTASEDGRIRTWSRSGELLSTIVGHAGSSVTTLAFRRDGTRMVSGAEDGTLRVWNVDEARPETDVFHGHEGRVNAVAFSPDGDTFASGGEDENVNLWDVFGNPLGVMREHEAAVNSLAFRGDGEAIVSGSADHLVLLAEVQKRLRAFGELLAPEFRGIDAAVRSVALTPDDQRIVVGSSDTTVRTGDWLSSQIELPRHVPFAPKSVSLADDSVTFLAAGWSDTLEPQRELRVERWKGTRDAGSTRVLGRFTSSGSGDLVLTGDGTRLVLANTIEGLVIWQLDDARARPVRAPIDEPMSDFAVDHRGDLVAGAFDSFVRLWSGKDGRVLGDVAHAGGALRDLAFGRDAPVLVGATNDCVLAWRLRAPQARAFGSAESPSSGNATIADSAPAGAGAEAVVGEQDPSQGCVPGGRRIASVGVSATGEHVAAGGTAGTIWLWRLEDWSLELETSFKAHNGPVTDIIFRPRNGDAILSSGNEGTVRLWDFQGHPLARLSGHEGRVLDVDFSANGYTAASVGKDNTVRVWAAHWRQWVTVGCKRLASHARYRRPELNETVLARLRAEEARQTCDRFEPGERPP